MASRKGTIAIMGSGETTDSMVRVHRYLLDKLTRPVRAVFIDTPAGFQMNADDLFEKAREYFQKRFNQAMVQAAFKSSRDISPYEAEKAFQTLREADYIFVGPGSPTYALKNWIGTPIPQILFDRVQSGACFVAASAAALTLGRFTLPVYEIYKVGEEPKWVEGLDLLGMFGLPAVVIPHWNNAEGGTHDTRFCYMGEPRLMKLEDLLPFEIPILGIDEHTACILDLEEGRALVRGIGEVTLRYREGQKTFRDGQDFSFEEIKKISVPHTAEMAFVSSQVPSVQPPGGSFGERVKSLKESFDEFLKEENGSGSIDVLMDMDKMIWKVSRDFEDEEQVSQARELFRGMIVQLGLRFDESPKDIRSVLSPLVEMLLEVREEFRSMKQWNMADRIRDKMFQAGVIVEDTPQGPRWRLSS